MKNPITVFTDYLAEKQTPGIRIFHISILILVISQIILSNFMEIDRSGNIGIQPLEFIGTWAHFILGLLTLLLALIFVILEFSSHGFKYFFPYLYGDFSQIRKDLATLMRLRLPEPNPYGLATVVQGLGLGAISLVTLSGTLWFYSWLSDASWSHLIKEVHETLTGLVEAYIIGHGGLGLLHIFFPSRRAETPP